MHSAVYMCIHSKYINVHRICVHVTKYDLYKHNYPQKLNTIMGMGLLDNYISNVIYWKLYMSNCMLQYMCVYIANKWMYTEYVLMWQNMTFILFIKHNFPQNLTQSWDWGSLIKMSCYVLKTVQVPMHDAIYMWVHSKYKKLYIQYVFIYMTLSHLRQNSRNVIG